MRRIQPNQLDFTPLRVGMAARGLQDPIIEAWVIRDGAFHNKEKNRWLTSKQFESYKEAAAWDGILCLLECLHENEKL